MSLQHHLNSTAPKRILALDGGGIRGALTLGYLKTIEDVLKAQHGAEDDFRLCDYFDLIGGTSTGAIIAAALAMGMSVDDVKTKYFELGGEIFGKKYHWWNPFELDELVKAGFDSTPLETELHKLYGDITMGSDKLKTGLCIVAKRADTNSVWPIINHPGGKYFNSADGINKDIPVWKAVRASAAAPTYFIPQVINVGGGMPDAAFIDGGVSMANNPSLQLLMVATLKGFPFRWKLGAENILVVSVGTGINDITKMSTEITKNNILNWAQEIPDMLMQDANWQNQIILQWLSKSPTAISIDGEIGDMCDDVLSTEVNSNGLLSYLRYNVIINHAELKRLMNKDYTDKEVKAFADMSNAATRFELFDIGYNAGKDHVKEIHFPEYFNAVKLV
jgi:patatin-like phospholipase/acyl hydrolase